MFSESVRPTESLTITNGPLLRPVKGKPGKFEPITRHKQGREEVKMWGEAEVKQDAPGKCSVRVAAPTRFRPNRTKPCGCGKFHFIARNKIVGQVYQYYRDVTQGLVAQTNFSSMRVGTGAGSTGVATTALVTPSATAPNSNSATSDNPSSGVFRAKLTCTWNAGAIAALLVKEIEIRVAANLSGGTPMYSRLSSTDGDFTEFTINTAVPLSIEYRSVFTWA